MVVSKIDKKVSYNELKKICADDKELEFQLYEITVKGVDIIVAVGNPKKTYEENGIIFFPIYLVKSNNSVVQIGVYEIPSYDIMKYMTGEINVNVEKLDEPLIYTFVTKTWLEKKRLVPPQDTESDKSDESDTESESKKESVERDSKRDKIEHDSESKSKSKSDNETDDEDTKVSQPANEIAEQRKDIFILTKGVSVPPPLKEETKKKARDIREKYKEELLHIWIQKYMKNPNYGIVENEGNSDCLFATIRDAFSQIAQQTSVPKLRKKVSDEVTNEVFLDYKEQYDELTERLTKNTNEIKTLAREYQNIKDKFASALDRKEQIQLKESAKQVKEQHDVMVLEKRVVDYLLRKFKFMKGIDSLDKLKTKIKTCDFWANAWSISTLERILNIKFIPFSVETYKEKDLINVLSCVNELDPILKNKGEFMPDYYIMVEYSGANFRLISYKERQIFTFKELPFDVKKLIADKCMESDTNPFAIIPDFQKFKEELYKGEKKEKSKTKEVKYDDLTEAKLRGVYNENIVFSFYSNSSSKNFPGEGPGEKIPPHETQQYLKLDLIPDWRKKLDNTWQETFTLDNHTWTSVEHYYQASKFKKNNPEFYLSFSLDSGTELSKNVDMAKGAGGKTGKYKDELIRPVEVEIDPEFYGERHEKELYDAQYAKFTQNPDLRKMLLETHDAKLVHQIHGKPPEIAEGLMLIRDKLRRE